MTDEEFSNLVSRRAGEIGEHCESVVILCSRLNEVYDPMRPTLVASVRGGLHAAWGMMHDYLGGLQIRRGSLK